MIKYLRFAKSSRETLEGDSVYQGVDDPVPFSRMPNPEGEACPWLFISHEGMRTVTVAIVDTGTDSYVVKSGWQENYFSQWAGKKKSREEQEVDREFWKEMLEVAAQHPVGTRLRCWGPGLWAVDGSLERPYANFLEMKRRTWNPEVVSLLFPPLEENPLEIPSDFE